ncbi:MAG TPA: cupin [Pirellulales bacterium]|nr:cupin [Pirellulales bacterium]
MTQPTSIAGQSAFVRPLTTAEEQSRQIALVKTPHVKVIQLLVPAGRDVPTHQAQGELIVHCLEGRVSLFALGNTYDLTPGQLLHLSIDEPFSFRGIDNASVLLTLIAEKAGGRIELIGG